MHANADAPAGEYNAVARVNTKTGRVDSYSFGKHTLTEEPLFVPTGSKEGQGYLVNTCLNFRTGHTYCNASSGRSVNTS
ncbi:carotenoid oxygenase family protein [Aestuariibacter sp. A3R04]|nr:carotenoid oxygenase family protein [Aestuariibacter sp. A3R04]